MHAEHAAATASGGNAGVQGHRWLHCLDLLLEARRLRVGMHPPRWAPAAGFLRQQDRLGPVQRVCEWGGRVIAGWWWRLLRSSRAAWQCLLPSRQTNQSSVACCTQVHQRRPVPVADVYAEARAGPRRPVALCRWRGLDVGGGAWCCRARRRAVRAALTAHGRGERNRAGRAARV